MKLSKAIELNNEVVRSLREGKKPDHADAVSLGTEAIKVELKWRSVSRNRDYPLLPGEDKE